MARGVEQLTASSPDAAAGGAPSCSPPCSGRPRRSPRVLAADLLIVTDDRGRVLVASERHRKRPEPAPTSPSLPVVRRALDPSLPTDASNFGVVQFAGDYFQVGRCPSSCKGFRSGP